MPAAKWLVRDGSHEFIVDTDTGHVRITDCHGPEPSMDDNNREKVLRGEVVRVSDSRLVEMQIQSIECEGVTPTPVYHWHWAAVLNELVALRKIAALAAEARGIDLGYETDRGAE